ncbi:uncharacterized protein LOC141800291 [Halichoeres trimaculatus]|uniref:uncharacterized protein LOC141800291 n=1 Tax=Halichoeres trimaculatus TaxID=147232 RepID=UPI003D9E908E
MLETTVPVTTSVTLGKSSPTPKATEASTTLEAVTSTPSFIETTSVQPTTSFQPTIFTSEHTSNPSTNSATPSSIATSTALETTTTPAPPPEPKIALVFKVQQNFTEELSNTSSPEFKALEGKVSKALDQVYSAQFGARFNRTVIKGFSKGSVKVDAELVFNDAGSLPNTSSVAETLVAAASSSNFSLGINTSSIVVTTVSAPTQAPVKTTFTTPLTSQGSTTSAGVTTTSTPIETTSSQLPHL